jgi:hypothetical protein
MATNRFNCLGELSTTTLRSTMAAKMHLFTCKHSPFTLSLTVGKPCELNIPNFMPATSPQPSCGSTTQTFANSCTPPASSSSQSLGAALRKKQEAAKPPTQTFDNPSQSSTNKSFQSKPTSRKTRPLSRFPESPSPSIMHPPRSTALQPSNTPRRGHIHLLLLTRSQARRR